MSEKTKGIKTLTFRIEDRHEVDGADYVKINDMVFARVVEEKPEPPKRYCGLTAEQWQKAAEIGAIAYFSDYQNLPSINNTPSWLGSFVNDGQNGFKDASGIRWKYATLARLPGHIIPWFGGEYPGHPDDVVLTNLNAGGWGPPINARNVNWSDANIDAYIILNKAGK